MKVVFLQFLNSDNIIVISKYLSTDIRASFWHAASHKKYNVFTLSKTFFHFLSDVNFGRTWT